MGDVINPREYLGDLLRDYAAVARFEAHGMARRVNPTIFESGFRRPCIVIPGVYETWYFMRRIIAVLHAHGHPVHVITALRRNRDPIAESAQLLAEFMTFRELDDVFVAAHSKGGLIAKYAMVQLDAGQRIRNMVAIATPFSGSRYASYAPTSALRAFRPEDPVTQQLVKENRVNHRIISVFGAFDPVIPEGSVLPGAQNVRLPIGGHFRVLQHPITLKTALTAAG